MQRRIWSLLIIGSLLATMAIWTSHGQAAPGTPVASPTASGDCDSAIADVYTVLELLKADTASWAIYGAILDGNSGWVINDGEDLAAAAAGFQKVADELPNVPLRSVEGKAFSVAITARYGGLAKLLEELSKTEVLSDRYAIAALYQQPLSDLSDEVSESLRGIRDMCGVERVSFDATGAVAIDNTPVPNPVATPKP